MRGGRSAKPFTYENWRYNGGSQYSYLFSQICLIKNKNRIDPPPPKAKSQVTHAPEDKGWTARSIRALGFGRLRFEVSQQWDHRIILKRTFCTSCVAISCHCYYCFLAMLSITDVRCWILVALVFIVECFWKGLRFKPETFLIPSLSRLIIYFSIINSIV